MVELGNLRKDRNIKIMCGRYVLYSKEKFKNCLEESKLNNLFYQYGGTWKSKKR